MKSIYSGQYMDQKKPPINYVYFGLLFLTLILMTAGSIFTKKNHAGSQFFFLFYAIGQITLEISLLIFFTHLIRKYLGNRYFNIAIGIVFFGLILHVLDSLMDRILNLSILEVINIFVLQESFENFIHLLSASGISGWVWIVIFLTLGAIPLIGIGLYKLTELISKKWPLSLSHSSFLQVFLCIPCALFFFDFSASNIIHPDAYTAFTNSLPWKYTFSHPRSTLITLEQPLTTPQSEDQIAQAIKDDSTSISKKPNIYLFVVESLREDAITSSIAPHLNEFKNEYSNFDMALSNGNGTHISWFSTFHSQFPFHWAKFQKNWKMGSPALNLLKKWGYKINVYTSAQLAYYGMDKLIFGNNLELIDNYQTFHYTPPQQAADTDALAIIKLQQDLQESPSLQEGQVFIVFWDCTHFDYSWPKDWVPKFIPFSKETAYFKAFQSKKTISQIKNRYYNSVNYMDSLFGQFFDHLPNKEQAIVVVMGDHGEEFFEHGHLFHNSHLTAEQTHIPLYFKLGDQHRKLAQFGMASQMDIFPTILDYVKGSPISFLEGHSLFEEVSWPYIITSRFNGGGTPYEFSINNGTHKLIARFSNKKNILQSKKLQIISLRTRKDLSIPESKTDLHAWIEKEFGPALPRLFIPKIKNTSFLETSTLEPVQNLFDTPSKFKS